MPVDPAQFDGLALKGLRNLIAASAHFQSLVGAANAAEAAEFVYYHESANNTDTFFAIVGKQNSDSPDILTSIGQSGQCSHEGDVSFDLLGAPGAFATFAEQLQQFFNDTSQIITEMKAVARDHLDFRVIAIGRPFAEHEDEMTGQLRYFVRQVVWSYFGGA